MESELFYAIAGIIGFTLIGYFTLKGGNSAKNIKTKAEMRLEMTLKYKKSLTESLKDFDPKDKMRRDKKIMLLREYSDELSRNIYFDKDEVKEIISELSVI